MDTAVIVLVAVVLCTQVAIVRQQQIIVDQLRVQSEDQLRQMLRVEDCLREAKVATFQAKIVADQAKQVGDITKVHASVIGKTLLAMKGGNK